MTTADQESHAHPVEAARVEAARSGALDRERAHAVSEIFRLLGDPVRTRLLSALLAGGELCVGDLALAIETPETTVSYALRHLRTGGLVQNRRAGRMVFYRLSDELPARMLALATSTVE
ncbi:MAG: ArsR/SmtB family transcription factor [Egibacteraceae bacterium]